MLGRSKNTHVCATRAFNAFFAALGLWCVSVCILSRSVIVVLFKNHSIPFVVSELSNQSKTMLTNFKSLCLINLLVFLYFTELGVDKLFSYAYVWNHSAFKAAFEKQKRKLFKEAREAIAIAGSASTTMPKKFESEPLPATINTRAAAPKSQFQDHKYTTEQAMSDTRNQKLNSKKLKTNISASEARKCILIATDNAIDKACRKGVIKAAWKTTGLFPFQKEVKNALFVKNST